MIFIFRKKGEHIKVESATDAVNFVISEHEQRVKDNDPIILELSHDSYGHLAIGVGVGGRIFLTHTPADLNPPYRRSVGLSRSGHYIVYLYGGSPTEIETGNLVSDEYIGPVLKDFILTGMLSDRIKWEDV